MWQHVKKGVSGDANRVLDNAVLLFGWGSLKRKLIAYLHEMMANPWGVNSKNMQQTFVELKNELTNAEGLPKDFMKKFTQLDTNFNSFDKAYNSKNEEEINKTRNDVVSVGNAIVEGYSEWLKKKAEKKLNS